MGKILHFVTDEKFTDYAIQQFSAPEMESVFVLIPSNWAPDSVMYCLNDSVKIIKQRSPEFSQLLTHLGDYSAIILHGMHWGNWQTPILKVVPNHVKVAWMFWGGEIYGRSDCPDNFLAPVTALIVRVRSFFKGIKGQPQRDINWQIPKELYKRVEYCLTGEAEEYEYAKTFLDHLEMKHIWYTYYSMEETVGTLINERVSGENVWLGNSATASNNFFDALLRLRWYGLRGCKLIVPLSYGSPWIRNSVARIGNWLFGSRFVPLLEFLPREDYNKLMLDCGTMIMPHYNPQAQGNILTGLWLGMRVYLSERSMTYTFFKRIGASIFSFESDFKKYGCTPITEEEFQTNRAVMTKWYGKQHVKQAVRDVVSILSQNDEQA